MNLRIRIAKALIKLAVWILKDRPQLCDVCHDKESVFVERLIEAGVFYCDDCYFTSFVDDEA